MIPRRIALEGFLSYRGRQEFDFEGAPIWMLAGPNGSGKSAVFDALTFTLFNAHRGGKTNHEALIHVDCQKLLVEVDLQIGRSLFRLQRGARRNKGRPSRQVLRHDPANPDQPWSPEPGTETEAGFQTWVREHVGMSYETFTSSVLLTQGGAERLIAAKPGEKLECLKQIVELDRFARLHQKVADRRKAMDQQARTLDKRLSGLEEIGEDQLVAVEAAVATAAAAREQAAQRRESLTAEVHHAQRWAKLQSERAGLDRWLLTARPLLEQAEAIERDHDRLRALDTVLPTLSTLLDQRQRGNSAEQTLLTLAEQIKTHNQTLLDAEEAETQARKRLESTREAGEAARAQREDVSRGLRDLARPLATLGEWARQQEEITRLEQTLATFPADLAAQTEAAGQDLAHRAALREALPHAQRLITERDALRMIHDQRQKRSAERDQIQADLPGLEDLLTEAVGQAAAAKERYQRASTATARAETLVDQAGKSLSQLDSLGEQAECDRCGQPLTPDHLATERIRRGEVLRTAQIQSRSDRSMMEQARQDLEATEKARELRQGGLSAARGRLNQIEHQEFPVLDRDVKHHTQAGLAAWSALPSAVLNLAGPEPTDWTLVDFPTPEHVSHWQELTQGRAFKDSKRRHEELTAQTVEATRAGDQLAAARQRRQALANELPDDPGRLQEEDQALRLRETGLNERLEELRRQYQADQAALKSHEQAVRAAREAWNQIVQEQTSVNATLAAARAAVKQARATLPDEWRPIADSLTPLELDSLRHERQALDEHQTLARYEALRQARSQWDVQFQRLEALSSDEATIPLPARRDPAEVSRELESARSGWTALDAAFRQAESERAGLQRRKHERAAIVEERLALDKSLVACKLLEKLLGPRGLQRDLVRQAEVGIVENANRVLDHLTQGRLTLRLRGQDPNPHPHSNAGRITNRLTATEDSAVEDDRETTMVQETALELEVKDRETRRTIPVEFLSGSQKFRVAVSLALGIGRYASRLHRPIEAVIIDEGFGCLDREGRQMMIQELHNLAGTLERIILVSHQDEFADAFTDGYRLEYREGASVARKREEMDEPRIDEDSWNPP